MLFGKVTEYFQGDESKTFRWFSTPNPQFGGVPPRAMLRNPAARQHLQRFVDEATEANAAAPKGESAAHGV